MKRVLALLVCGGVLLVTAACGTGAAGSSSSASPSSSPFASRSQFVACLKQHGVTGPAFGSGRRPGFGSGGPPGFGSGSPPAAGAGPLSRGNLPKNLQKAFTACGKSRS
ncbi:MAG TPA: hypothetical protein VG815_01150 [Chloroflexota bacterium]|jgi:hypothetical protein|nr:hypothetical protein [Chloroflexota bacterium]